jgi:hypothetical protein
LGGGEPLIIGGFPSHVLLVTASWREVLFPRRCVSMQYQEGIFGISIDIEPFFLPQSQSIS